MKAEEQAQSQSKMTEVAEGEKDAEKEKEVKEEEKETAPVNNIKAFSGDTQLGTAKNYPFGGRKVAAAAAVTVPTLGSLIPQIRSAAGGLGSLVAGSWRLWQPAR